MIAPQLNPQKTDIVVGKQSLKKEPFNHPLIAKGTITKQGVVEHVNAQEIVTRVDLTLTINGEKVKVFINDNHEHFNYWKIQPDGTFCAQMKFSLKSFNEQYQNFKGVLYAFVYEEPQSEAILADRFKQHFGVHYKALKSKSLQTLWCQLLANEELKQRFYQAPSSKVNAFNFKGGLAMHTAKLMDAIDGYIDSTIPQYIEYYRPAPLNKDLLKTGALFHDLGKMFAYEFKNGVVVDTPEGRFLGVATLSLQLLNRLYAEMIQEHPELILPYQDYLELQHMVASVNRELEYGALAVPKTKEAELLAFLENTVSRLGDYETLEQNHCEPDFYKLFTDYVYVKPYHGDYSEFYPAPTVINPQEVELAEVPTTSTPEETFDESSDYEEDFTYEPTIGTEEVVLETPSSEPVVAIDVQPVLIEESMVTPLETPFIGESTQQVVNVGEQPSIVTPVMNIPQEWPQTPSTAPVLVNGIPPQPVMSVQQPMDSNVIFTPNTPTESVVNSFVSELPFRETPLADVIPFEPQAQKSVEVSTEEVATETVEEVVKPKTTRKTTKSTKAKDTTDKTAVEKPKTTRKSTKSTKPVEEPKEDTPLEA